MLVEQAAEAFAFWRGVEPETAPVLAALRAPARLRHDAHRAAARWAVSPVLLLLRVVALQLYFLARIALMSVVDPQSTTFQRSEAWRLALAAARARLAAAAGSTTAAIATSLKRAVIAAEDAGFTEHSGVEWDALEKAWERNSRAEAVAEQANERAAAARGRARAEARPARPPAPAKVVGGSTITQQLAKNLFLGGERNFVRKAQELILVVGAGGAARQAAHPRDLSEQRRMGRRRVRRRGGGAALLRAARRASCRPARRRSWR